MNSSPIHRVFALFGLFARSPELRTRAFISVLLLTVTATFLFSVWAFDPGPWTPQNAHAKSKGSRLREISSQQAKIKSKIRHLKSQKRSLSQQIQDLDETHERLEQELDVLRKDLHRIKKEYKEQNIKLHNLTKSLEVSTTAFSARVVSYYKNGRFTYLRLLTRITDLSDLIDRIYYLNQVFKKDEEIISTLKDAKRQVEIQRAVTEQKRKELEAVAAKVAAEDKKVKESIAEKQETMAAVEKDQHLYEQMGKELEAESRRIEKELRGYKSKYKGPPWKGSFRKPAQGGITSGFGYRIHPIYRYRRFHSGVDISTPYGAAIVAAATGQVIYAGWRSGYGKTIMIDHGGGLVTLYAHLARIEVSEGEIVTVGERIGSADSTGLSTGNHLHFEVRVNGSPVNPLGR